MARLAPFLVVYLVIACVFAGSYDYQAADTTDKIIERQIQKLKDQWPPGKKWEQYINANKSRYDYYNIKNFRVIKVHLAKALPVSYL